MSDDTYRHENCRETAAERDRLLAVNAELLGALKMARVVINAYYITDGLTTEGRTLNLRPFDDAIKSAEDTS